MTRALSEDSPGKRVAGLGWDRDQLYRRPPSGPAVLFIKVFADDEESIVEEGAFVFEVGYDMDDMTLQRVETYVTTAGGTAVIVQIRNAGPTNTGGTDMLTTPVTIAAGDLSGATTLSDIDIPNSGVSYDVTAPGGDFIAIDVDSGADGDMGLGVKLWFADIDQT